MSDRCWSKCCARRTGGQSLRNLMTAWGHLIMSPILKPPNLHQSGLHLEEVHDLRLSHPPWIKPSPADTLVLSQTRAHHRTGTRCRGPPPPGPRQLLRLADAVGAVRPAASGAVSPQVADSRQKRNRRQQMGGGGTCFSRPSRALCPCHMSVTLVFWSDNTSRRGLSVFQRGHKRGKGGGKSWRGLSSLRRKILWKSRHQEKNQIKRQQKRSSHTKKKKLLCTPTVPPCKNSLGPQEVIKRSVSTHRNVCKESARTKAICNLTKWQS